MAQAVVDNHSNLHSSNYVLFGDEERNKDKQPNEKARNKQKRNGEKNLGANQKNSSSSAKAPSSSDDSLSWIMNNKNAWMMALGIMMQEFAKVAKTNMQVVNTLNKASAGVAEQQSEAAQAVASAALAGGAAAAVGSSVSAISSGISGVKSGKNTLDMAKETKAHNTKLQSLHDAKNKLDDPERATINAGKGGNKFKTKAELDFEIDKAKNDFEQKGRDHENAKTGSQIFGQIGGLVGQTLTQVGQANSQGAQEQQKTVQSLDQDMASQLNSAKQSAESSAQQATKLEVAQVAVAAVRG